MVGNIPVKINLATIEEISRLHGIGRQLARRVVKHRGARGYFQGPEDLAAVDGISLELALTLSPHIDWQVPASPEPPLQRNWFALAMGFMTLLAMVWVFQIIFPVFYMSLRAYEVNPKDYLPFLLESSSLVSWILLFPAFACFLGSLWSTKTAQSRRLARIGFFLGTPAILLIVARDVAEMVILRGLKGLLADPRMVIYLLYFSASVSLLAIIVALFLRPALRANAKLARGFEIASMIAGPVFALVIWLERDAIPLWFMLLLSCFGILFIRWSFLGVAKGESFYETIIRSAVFNPSSGRKIHGTSTWVAWINSRLPDPEHQKELKRVLDEMFPPSRLKTLSSLIVFSAGAWIVGTALSAIVEWFVQNWLEQFLR
jgi:hypothetical protein